MAPHIDTIKRASRSALLIIFSMKTYALTKFCAQLTIGLLLVNQASRAADAAPPETEFEKAYRRWKVEIATTPEISNASDTRMFSCQSFKDLVNLGLPVLPEVVAKLSEDVLLAPAVYQISRKRFPDEVTRKLYTNEQVRRHYQTWWSTAEQDTATSFTEEFGKWKQAKLEGKHPEAKTRLEHVKDLGRLALPHLFGNIAKGETDLIPIASELVNGAFSPTATPAQCEQWWSQNKAKWSIHRAANGTPAKETP